MKKINLTGIFLGLSVFAGLVYADVPLQSNEDVQGSWKLEYTKKSATATDTIKREDTWTFKGDTVTITHIPREGTFYDQSPVHYEIEGGKLKISLLGRSDKFDVFSLVEKDEKTMVLKGKFGDIYRFNKK
ncbi:MAG: lipocalin family protein [Methylomonas sp.]